MSNKKISTPIKSPSPSTHQNRNSFLTPSPTSKKDLESSIIKRELRQKLDAFLSLRREWDDVVLSRGLRCAMKIIELEADIDATFQYASFIQACKEEDVELMDGYAWKQW
ncbi:uncharacterized protein MELLADRAFT_71567 [Melampsora larici-populina 98AG31]|uniref:Uncharacterized protein n=1 Tax=Melampsora larici-populina (strain 98AG31 / pathotype 3-4-7) TaxID=747676 RepID=F4RHY6_MELLP|nr:uncharacterized protein MELLADRAFT_71567 [Melampsora larici-populina 98AG31]EGG08048.1 hypothetical protein MELLADRAFT_71567 [Melampsora larici-populina 98AG31]